MSWLNPNGYECVLLKSGEGIVFDGDLFLFRLKNPPLRWLCADGAVIEPCRKAVTSIDVRQFETDLGSVPFLASWFLSRTQFARAYGFHDIAYRFAGWWGINAVDGSYYRVHCTREVADQMLYEMALADGATRAQARAIWLGVRAGGWWVWNKYRKEDKKARIKHGNI